MTHSNKFASFQRNPFSIAISLMLLLVCLIANPDFSTGQDQNQDQPTSNQADLESPPTPSTDSNQEAAEPTATAEPPSKIYLAADDHTDYFWTADDVTYRTAFLETIDYYLDQADRTKDAPSEYQARWNCDGSLWLWEYEQNKSPAEFQRLIERIRDGHISAPMTALANTYGAQPAEAVLRGMYYAGKLEREHDLKFSMAVAMENQTLPLGLGALWAGSGAKYSWRGICACATKMDYEPFQDRDKEIYWWNGIDGSRILMKWYSLGDNNASIGGYAEARKPRHAIDWVRTNEGFKKRHPFGTIGIFGQGWDDLKTLSDEFPQIARETSTPDQQVIVSNEEDFFRDFEKHYGPRLGSESLAYGNEWDLYCMSMAEQTAKVRRSVEKLRTAEALATIVSKQNPKFWSDRRKTREQAHMNLGLYWEHDWTADASEEMRTKRGSWQRKLADQITAYVDELHEAALNKLAQMVPSKKHKQRFVVFNSLGWKRSGTVEINIAKLLETNPTPNRDWVPFDVETGQELPVVSYPKIGNSEPRQTIHVRVKDVPSVGYRVIELRPEADGSLNEETVIASPLENEHLKVTISPTGSIISLIDKKTGRELAGPNGLNVLSGLSPAGSKLTGSIRTGSEKPSLWIRSNAGLPHTTEVTLRDGENWIEITNTITANFADVRSWDFDFAIENSEVHHEEVGAILRAKLTFDGGHYAAKNARYDWLSLGHFLNIRGTGASVTLSNSDCAFFKLGNSSPKRLDSSSSKISVLAGGQVDGPKLGIRNQGGDKTFTQRFAIRVNQRAAAPAGSSASGSVGIPWQSMLPNANADALDSANEMRWSLERQNPLVSTRAVGNGVTVLNNGIDQQQVERQDAVTLSNKKVKDGLVNPAVVIPEDKLLADSKASSLLPEKSFSFLSVDDSVLLWALKPSEEGIENGIIARAWNVSDTPAQSKLIMRGLTSANEATHIETDTKPIVVEGDSIKVSFQRQQMKTIRLKVKQ